MLHADTTAWLELARPFGGLRMQQQGKNNTEGIFRLR
jgi:hypothetical protein